MQVKAIRQRQPLLKFNGRLMYPGEWVATTLLVYALVGLLIYVPILGIVGFVIAGALGWGWFAFGILPAIGTLSLRHPGILFLLIAIYFAIGRIVIGRPLDFDRWLVWPILL